MSDDIREQFVNEFLSTYDFEGKLPNDFTMPELLDIWDVELCSNAVRWKSINMGYERSELDIWLEEHEYTYPAAS